jgi:hypothetical protein
MSPRIPDTHAEAWDLLPWLANGRIAAADREWVEAHVQTCAECRAELSAQRMLAGGLRDAGAVPVGTSTDEQRSFDKLWARIEAAESAAPAAQVATAGPRRASRPVRWLAAAVVVQGIGLALFGFNALRSPQADDPTARPGYVTVTSNTPVRTDAPMVSLVFEPKASMEAVNTLLAHQELIIVSGPGRSGNFTAALSANAVASGATAESVAAVISKDPNVTFAQPIAR